MILNEQKEPFSHYEINSTVLYLGQTSVCLLNMDLFCVQINTAE